MVRRSFSGHGRRSPAGGQRPRGERGAVLIETAMVLPLMLFVCVGIFEFGRAFQHWQIVTNAAREGARIAVLPGMDDSKVTERVRIYLEAGALEHWDTTDVTIVRNTEVPIGAGSVMASNVTVEYPFAFMVLQPVAELVVPNSTVGTAFTMTASTTMRNE
jgi:Flp pilus assembly protein TadG